MVSEFFSFSVMSLIAEHASGINFVGLFLERLRIIEKKKNFAGKQDFK